MKTILFIASIVVCVLILIQTYVMASVNKTEEQKYTVIESDEDFEIRFYPSATLATIKSEAKTYKDLSGPGFRELAGYIFGGNEGNTQIAMTSPVHMNINDTASTMSFVMPSGYQVSNLPKPNSSSVVFEETKDEYIAAIRFGGFATDKELSIYAEKLRQILDKKGIKANGNVRFLGYNPPFQLIGRRNEVVVSITWKE